MLPVRVALALALLAAPALAATRKVPTEAYPTIQSAINGSDDGDTVVVAAGNYETGFSVGEFTKLTIRFKPGAVIQGGTVSLASTENVTIVGLTMQAPVGAKAFSASNCLGLTVTGLSITGASAEGISLFQCDGARIRKCKVVNCVGEGLTALESLGVLVDKCTFEGNGNWAIILGSEIGADGARVTRNQVQSEGYGIYVSASDAVVEKNTVSGMSETAIYVNGSSGIVVQKNVLYPTDGMGLEVHAEAGVVAKNTVLGYSDDAIRVVGHACRVEKNRVTNSWDGIYIQGNLPVVAKNTATDCGLTAFTVWGNQATITKNRAVDTDNVAFNIFAPGSTLTGNVADGAGDWGFFTSTGAVMTKNAAIDCADGDLLTTASEGVFTMTKNRFVVVVFNYVDAPL